jgi:hypothetical protein
LPRDFQSEYAFQHCTITNPHDAVFQKVPENGGIENCENEQFARFSRRVLHIPERGRRLCTCLHRMKLCGSRESAGMDPNSYSVQTRRPRVGEDPLWFETISQCAVSRKQVRNNQGAVQCSRQRYTRYTRIIFIWERAGILRVLFPAGRSSNELIDCISTPFLTCFARA